MPTYTYVCGTCGAEVPLYRPVNGRDWDAPCLCGENMKRKIDAPNFTVKGFNAKNGYSNGEKETT